MTFQILCKVDGCDNHSRHLGWCRPHYRRFNRYGDPLGGSSNRYKNPDDAFDARSVARSDGCVEWTGAKDQKGYGQLRVNGKLTKAHRYAVEREIGPIPFGMVVMHICDNPKCVNISHLMAGSQTDNVRDMDVKGRRVNNQPKGIDSGNAKITDDDVRSIRSDTRRQVDIAETYGISQSVVSKIKLYQAWSHVK